MSAHDAFDARDDPVRKPLQSGQVCRQSIHATATLLGFMSSTQSRQEPDWWKDCFHSLSHTHIVSAVSLLCVCLSVSLCVCVCVLKLQPYGRDGPVAKPQGGADAHDEAECCRSPSLFVAGCVCVCVCVCGYFFPFQAGSKGNQQDNCRLAPLFGRTANCTLNRWACSSVCCRD